MEFSLEEVEAMIKKYENETEDNPFRDAILSGWKQVREHKLEELRKEQEE